MIYARNAPIKLKTMKILFFGFYDTNDPVNNRTRLLLSGLKDLGVMVDECVVAGGGIRQWPQLVRKYGKIEKNYDIIFLAHGGVQLAAPLAKILSRKKIVVDPIVSLYDTMVYDRKKCRRLSLKGVYYYILDWLMVKLADIIILDTDENIKYFAKTFGGKRSKFRRLFIGSENLPCLHEKVRGDNFMVHFHGYFIPLHGIEYIIRAAKILENENIVFRIIGRGQTYKQSRKLADDLGLSNVTFIDPVPRNDIQKYICGSSIVLGVFGDTDKALRVIPNKVYDALASGRALITADTPAARELLEGEKNCLLCLVASPEDLAGKILELKNNHELREKISKGGRELFDQKLTPKNISLEFKKILQDVAIQ